MILLTTLVLIGRVGNIVLSCIVNGVFLLRVLVLQRMVPCESGLVKGMHMPETRIANIELKKTVINYTFLCDSARCGTFRSGCCCLESQ